MTGPADKLRSGKPVFGLALTYPVAAYAELAAWCGYDFLIIDSEHGVAHEAAQIEVMRALAGTDTASLVRVRPGDDQAIGRYLDFGADGVIVPDVRSAEQARSIAQAATGRWTGGLRGDRYSGPARTAGGNPFILALIESPSGVAEIGGILDQGAISAAMVGSGDLSTALGRPGDFASQDYRDAVRRVEQATLSRNLVLGGKPEPGDTIESLVARGYRLFMIGRDTMLIRKAMLANLETVRSQA